MSPPEQLPWDLVGEILCRVPTKSLARFRAVCKQWNAIWEDRGFLNNYLSRARPQFIVHTKSEICSVAIYLDDDDDDDHVLSIEERNITLEYFPCKEFTRLVHCDGFVLFCMDKKGFAIWNPWVRQKRLVENHEFVFCGIGYDNTRPETGYKIFGHNFYKDSSGQFHHKFAIYECKSDAWKFINVTGEELRGLLEDSIVSINGNLYFLSFDSNAIELFIERFDFSRDIFKTISALPSIEGSSSYTFTHALAVFRGDRLSLLMQSMLTNKVEILVTKQKIDGNEEAIVWINFMTVSIPDFPSLQPAILCAQPSYFVDNNDDKRLFVCTSDATVQPCIYIVKGDVFRKISIDSVVDECLFASYISYIPSFVSIPCVEK